MDQALLQAYYATRYELPTSSGESLRVSLDGEIGKEPGSYPELLRKSFALLTAYNPRSMLLPRRVNEQRHLVLRDLLILGCYRIEPCVGYDPTQETLWREPAWLVHGMDRDEAVAFGRVFRQNSIIWNEAARAEIIVTDPTADDVGKAFTANWRLHS